MLLGKRGRGSMKRTTSMTGINVDLAGVEEPSDCNPDSLMNVLVETASPSLLDHRRSSGGCSMAMETAPFLRTCRLCNRRLRPSRHDIFMYRGDTAFCSLECREQQIKHDEREEKCSVAAKPMKDGNHHRRHHSVPATASATATSQA